MGKKIKTKKPVKPTTKLVPVVETMPAFPSKSQIDEYSTFLTNYDKFIDSQLKDKIDFGVIPGISKPTLFKPGAEKLEKLYFYRHKKVLVEKIVEDALIKYTYKTVIFNKAGRVVATCEGTCNSKEKKYRYDWETLPTPPRAEKEKTDKLKATGEYRWRKSGNDWLWQKRIEKKDYYDIENTLMKMAQKRSYVGAILEATNSSGRFTQDVEDIETEDTAEQKFKQDLKEDPDVPTIEVGEHGEPVEKPEKPVKKTPPQQRGRKKTEKVAVKCADCGGAVSPAEIEWSEKRYKIHPLCRNCQKRYSEKK